MNPQLLHDQIIYPTLEALGSKFNSRAARQLLLATAAQESHCGQYLKQIRGPALGLYQMEPNTISDLETNYLAYQKDLTASLKTFMLPNINDLHESVGNLFYATAQARCQYRRFPDALPEFDDFEGMWVYYKKYWNTDHGKATKEEFRTNWVKYVAPVGFAAPTKRKAKKK